ncbi:MAG: hypothetical protein L3J67_05225 [Hyphomicrobiaceae bacterium]|nr:hypothetical protein [Hyphomicrobiaceae bacterium]
MSILIEHSFWLYFILTCLLAGGAAYMTGRALAIGWSPLWQLVLAILILGGATRFLHFALFDGQLLSLHYYLTDTLTLMIISLLAFRMTRTTQMVTCYHWLYKRSTWLSFERK